MSTTIDHLVVGLDLNLQIWYRQLVADLARSGTSARLIQGWRDPHYQDQLKAQGVSPLSGDSSLHCCTLKGLPASKAFDLGIFENITGKYVTDGKDPRYVSAGTLWKGYNAMPHTPGLVFRWGGDFVHPRPDPDHFEIN